MDNSGTFLSPRDRSPQKPPPAPFIEEETRSSFTDQPSNPSFPVVLEEGGTPSQSLDGTDDSKSGKTKKKLKSIDQHIAEQALGKLERLYEKAGRIRSKN